MVNLIDLNILESTIHMDIKTGIEKKYKGKKGYEKLDFTTEEESKTKPNFPNVYVSLESTREENLMLERTMFEGGIFTFLVKITDNSGGQKVKSISDEVIRIMKRKMFTLAERSPYMNDSDTHWVTMRFNRKIDDDDFW